MKQIEDSLLELKKFVILTLIASDGFKIFSIYQNVSALHSMLNLEKIF